jgi:hypothetical protein
VACCCKQAGYVNNASIHPNTLHYVLHGINLTNRLVTILRRFPTRG